MLFRSISYADAIYNTIKKIHALKSEVICDGEKVTLKGPEMSAVEVLDTVEAPYAIVDKLHTAYEMGKEYDKVAAEKAYKLQQEAGKQARIEAKTKVLEDLFG